MIECSIFSLLIFNETEFPSKGLRWPEPIYMRVVYVSESRFSAGKI